MSKKQFRSCFILLGILLIAAFCLWISTLVNGNKTLNVFLSMLPLIALVVALRITKENFRDNTDVRWQLSQFQIYCIAEFAVGILLLAMIAYAVRYQKFREKHPLLVDEEIDEWTRLKKVFKKQK